MTVLSDYLVEAQDRATPELVHLSGEYLPTYYAAWPMRRFRFLLANGSTIDVLTERDDDTLRKLIEESSGQTIKGKTEVIG